MQVDKSEKQKTQTQLNKAIEESKKTWQKYSNLFVNAMKESGKSITEEYKELSKLFSTLKDDNGFIGFTKLFTENLSDSMENLIQKADELNKKQADYNQQTSNRQKNLSQVQVEVSEKAAAKDDGYGDSVVGKLGDTMSSEFSNGLQKMIKGYGDFSDLLKGMTNSLTNYIIKSFSDMIAEQIFSKQVMGALFNFAGGFMDGALGGIGGAFGFIKGLFKHHSGGVIPSGTSYSLPGTKEQLALLKGGERVLSPSENTSYESNGSGTNTVFNNFNIKAWDSKDVQKYLLENKQLLNSITYEGIKNNNCKLRSMVQNA